MNGQFNLFAAFWLLGGPALALGAAVWVGAEHGFGLAALTFAAILVAWFLLRELLGIAVDVLYRFFPLRPTCRNGRCQAFDYQWVRFGESTVTWRCGCGTEYRQEGAMFSEVDAEGRVRPYMRKHWGRWRPVSRDESR
ncbi:hypothetical protein [Archangium primigenium]|uniref:hypothetical protein n=1 Tax=[Archangium] primigenium TaxID=2792470 RepID=UPI00195F11FE|nr:hypothetical protein [Archangium primigenium]MBM7117020.1 hypothetical protein [Archangium primigenium]